MDQMSAIGLQQSLAPVVSCPLPLKSELDYKLVVDSCGVQGGVVLVLDFDPGYCGVDQNF